MTDQHVIVVVWVDDGRCKALCSCGWESKESTSGPVPLRVPGWVHRMANAVIAGDAAEVALEIASDMMSPKFRCRVCGAEACRRAPGYPGGLTDHDAVERGWDLRTVAREHAVVGVASFDTLVGRCPVCVGRGAG